MEREKYNQLYEDKKVFKYNEPFKFFKSKNSKLLLKFIFIYTGTVDENLNDSGKRIFLNLSALQNSSLTHPVYESNNDFLILVNCEVPDHALSYRITIDESTQSANVIIEDYPTIGESWIEEEEKTGISVFIT